MNVPCYVEELVECHGYFDHRTRMKWCRVAPHANVGHRGVLGVFCTVGMRQAQDMATLNFQG